jgi:hypothetical protein
VQFYAEVAAACAENLLSRKRIYLPALSLPLPALRELKLDDRAALAAKLLRSLDGLSEAENERLAAAGQRLGPALCGRLSGLMSGGSAGSLRLAMWVGGVIP